MRTCGPVVLCLVATALTVGTALPGAEVAAAPVLEHGIMHFEHQQLFAHRLRRSALKPAAIRPEALYAAQVAQSAGSNTVVNLLPFLAYSPSTWDQGGCGDCWVWGSTAACAIAAGVHTGSSTLLSVQYMNSTYNGGQDTATGAWACCGGNQETFATFYGQKKMFIPWSNGNAAFTDRSSSCSTATATPASTIATTPNFPFSAITDQVIPTSGIPQSLAIANLKAVLNNKQAIAFSFFLPVAGWNNFFSFWDNVAETTAWTGVDKYNGTTWGSGSGGHLVCIVGYDDTDGTWIALNSWGTTSLRPGGTFKIPQAMGYSNYMVDSGSQFDQYEFDVYDIAWPASSNTVTATITGPARGTTVGSGVATRFTGAGSDSSSSATLNYAWSFGDGATATGSSATHAYANPGTGTLSETVTLTVMDQTGSQGSNTTTLYVSPAPRNKVTATIAAPSANATLASGTSQSFLGQGTDSSASAKLTYIWDFGDGTGANGATAYHAYTNLDFAAVARTVTLTATDSTGVVAVATCRVLVAPRPRIVAATIAKPSAAVTIPSGTAQAFTGQGTDTAANATLTYAWNFGDGGSATGLTATHTFVNTGTSSLTRTVTLTATDNGGTTGTGTRMVYVLPQPRNSLSAAITTPSANIFVASGQAMAFAGKGTDSSSSATLTYAWTFGDGATATGIAPSHVYSNKGKAVVTWVATLTVTDSTGVVASATRFISVNPAK